MNPIEVGLQGHFLENRRIFGKNKKNKRIVAPYWLKRYEGSLGGRAFVIWGESKAKNGIFEGGDIEPIKIKTKE